MSEKRRTWSKHDAVTENYSNLLLYLFISVNDTVWSVITGQCETHRSEGCVSHTARVLLSVVPSRSPSPS